MKNWLEKNKDLLISMGLFVGPLVLLLGIFFVTKFNTEDSDIAIVEAPFVSHKPVQIAPGFDSIDILAKGVYVKELNTGKILYHKNANESLPLASITKMMTAVVAVEYLNDGSIVTIDQDSLETEGDSRLFLDERWNLKDLLNFTLVTSSNDGASAIASVVGSVLGRTEVDPRSKFVDQMNISAKKIGMTNTRFKNETGLDTNETIPGARGSAKDVTALFEYILSNHPELLRATTEDQFSVDDLSGVNHIVQNTNTIVDNLPNIVGSKTGFTELAGGNLSVIINPGLNNPVAITVLGSTYEGRFEDVKKLADATMQYYLDN